jgi:hypothetical protein
MPPPNTRGSAEYKKALTRLSNDPAYRKLATRNPNIITRDYKLSPRELYALRGAAVMSGADVREVNKMMRERAIDEEVRRGTSRAIASRSVDVDVDHCCCCCCCCGETAVVSIR